MAIIIFIFGPSERFISAFAPAIEILRFPLIVRSARMDSSSGRGPPALGLISRPLAVAIASQFARPIAWSGPYPNVVERVMKACPTWLQILRIECHLRLDCDTNHTRG